MQWQSAFSDVRVVTQLFQDHFGEDLLALALDSWLKGSSAPSTGVQSWTKKREARPLFRISGLCSFQCFDTTFVCQEGHVACKNNLCHLFQMSSSRISGERKQRGNREISFTWKSITKPQKLQKLTDKTAAYSCQDGQQQKEEVVIVGQQKTN